MVIGPYRKPGLAHEPKTNRQDSPRSGSTKGIGFAIATGLAREGARVIVNGRSEKAVAEAKEQIDQTVPEARLKSFAGDLSTAAAPRRCSSGSRSWTFSDNSAFRAKVVWGYYRRGMAAILRGQRAQRRALSVSYLPGMKERNWGASFSSAARARSIPRPR